MKNVSIHVIIWLLAFTINYIFFKNNVATYDLKYNLFIWLVYISLFYISYSYLIPRFLFRKRLVAFIAGSLILIVCSFTINQFMNVERLRSHEPEQSRATPFTFIPGPPVNNRAFQPPPDRIDSVNRPGPFGQLPGRPRPPGNFGIDFNRIMFPLYGLLLIYFASIIARMLLKFKEDEKKKEEIRKERISTELLYLKQQINPHFLFNTLNNIYSLSINNPEITPEAILKISSILRYTLYKDDNSPALLKDEIATISTYIEFQMLRFKNSLPVTYNVVGQVGNYKVEPFILLPIIENAFKYGMANIKDSFISILITIKNENLEFTVSNKKSFVQETDPAHSGIGLKNIKRRLDLVYAGQHEFSIDDGAEVFTVFLKLPLITGNYNELYSH